MDNKGMREEFIKIFKDNNSDIAVFYAPGRVNLIGEHTDYNGGHVLPCALTLGIFGAFRLRDDNQLRFYSLSYPQTGIVESNLNSLLDSRTGGWSNYPQGMIWTLQQKGYNISRGLDMLVYSHLPVGCGLSSSAALEVMTGLALSKLFNLSLTTLQLAQFGQYCENQYINVRCGIMDQFASAFGKADQAIFLDTNTCEYEYAPLNFEHTKIIIANTNVKHSLASSAYNQRRSQCENALKQLQTVCDIKSLGDINETEFEACKAVIRDETERKRARHAVYENQRTIRAYQALKNNDLARFGQLMNESHISLRDDYEVSCPQLDFLAQSGWMMNGVSGSRMTGGGFGGCTVSLVNDDAVASFITVLGQQYFEKFNLKAEFYIAQAGDGAKEIK